ncbi:hypothetical protein PCO31110_02342 [Pandoraea communis]|uniref:Uncharacterized protein n=1 Tax=Pandoraea communis TaxID=2508297 RepID=A0A5E4UYN3_9BURK|nr:hypothetical protein PCO31110_02342 [Pandoraea communis]
MGGAGHHYCLFVLPGWIFGRGADFGTLFAQI